MSEDMSEINNTDVLILGGGIAGLTSAVAFAREGLNPTVIEEKPILGGRARSWTDDETGDPVHIGPHIFTSEYPNFLQFQDIIGAEDTIVWQNDPFVMLVDGQTEIPKRRTKWLPTPLKYMPSEISDPTYSSKNFLNNMLVLFYILTMDEEDVRRLDNLNAYGFLKAMGVDEEFIDHVWRFSCRSIMNMPLELCSAGSLFRFYRQFVGYNDYDVGFPDGGLGETFVPQSEQFIEENGGTILKETTVTELIHENGSVNGAILSDGRKIESKYCLSTLPVNALQSVIPRKWERDFDYFGNLGRLEPCPYISPYIWFDRKLTDHKFWARSYRYEDYNTDFYDMSNIITDWDDRGSYICSNIIYSNRIGDRSDDEIIEETINELAEYIPEAKEAKVEHSVVNRIPLAIHCPYPGVESCRVNQNSPIKNFFVAGDWTDTSLPSSMESAAKSGWLAGEMILEREGIERDYVCKQKELDGLANEISKFGQNFPFKQIRKLIPPIREQIRKGIEN